jgi:signal transduction histidine kinase
VSVHWLVPRSDKQLHNLLYHLDFIPLLAAAMLFGWRTSIVATALTLAAETPQLRHFWPNDATYRFDQFGETAVAGIAGLVVGWLADRSRRQTVKLENTSRELSRVNQELQENIVRLRKAERAFAVAQMSATLAHEIRNPLASLAGAAGILKRGNASPANVRECFEIIDRESQRLNKLLADFLSFARPRAPRLQPTAMVELLDSVIALARHSEDARAIEFRRTVDGPLPEVMCDSEQIKQVMLNLIVNAVHATGKGVVHLDTSLRNGNVCIAVRDEGAGIPTEHEDRIFEPFFTTKETGSGLGLAIATQIAEQHGGTLTAQNTPGQGLTMILQLPLQHQVKASA